MLENTHPTWAAVHQIYLKGKDVQNNSVFIIHEIAELLKKIMFFLLFVCLKYRYVHVHPVTSHSVSSCAVSRLTELKQQA